MASPRKADEYRRSQSQSKFMSFPSRPEAHSMLLIFKDYQYKDRVAYESVGQRNNGRTVYSQAEITTTLAGSAGIELPFPKQLNDQTDLRLNGFERSLVTEGIAGYLTGKASSTASLADIGAAASSITGDLAQLVQGAGAGLAGFTGEGGGGKLVESITNALASISIKDAAASSAYLLRTFLPGDIGRSVGVYAGNITNPKETLAFEGVNLKSHSFSWELYPHSSEDSDIIRNITRFLKEKSLPAAVDVGQTAGANIRRAFLNYPSVVEIKLLGVNEQHFPAYKPCMIQNVTLDYGAPGTVPLMEGGKPGAVVLTIALQELEIHVSNDYSGNGVATQVINDSASAGLGGLGSN